MSIRNRKASQELLYRLADNLKRLREARGITQAELATRCHMHKNYVGNVEQAIVNITLANLEALARGLSCSEAELLMRHGARLQGKPP